LVDKEQAVVVRKQSNKKDVSKKDNFETKYKELQKTVFDLEAIIENLKSELSDVKDKNKVRKIFSI
jgi:predicted RNase H-like nuclease (RuvC/YqgF family)